MNYSSRGDFSVTKVLGVGGFGRALLAQPKDDFTKYVLKEVDLTKLEDAFQENQERLAKKVLEMARHEYDVMKELKHPNIVQVYHSFEEKTISTRTTAAKSKTVTMYYFLMEFCEGGDLESVINAAKQPFSEEQILSWSQQLCSAVNFLHGLGFVHRDIKPKNIFMSKCQTTLKLGDFGLTKNVDNVSINDVTAVCTVSYSSPAINDGKAYEKADDIWSLGVTLYQLANLKLPFEGRGYFVIRAILHSDPMPFANKYSAELQNFVLNMLVKDGSKRPTIIECLESVFLRNGRPSRVLEASMDPGSKSSPRERKSANLPKKKSANSDYGTIDDLESDEDEVITPTPSKNPSVLKKANSLPKSMSSSDQAISYPKISSSSVIPDVLKSPICEILRENYVTEDQLSSFDDNEVKEMFKARGLQKAVMDWRGALTAEMQSKYKEQLLAHADKMHQFAKADQFTPFKDEFKRARDSLPVSVAFTDELRSALIEHRDLSDYGNTFALQAAENGGLELLKYLINECRADVYAKDNLNGDSAIHLAASRGYISIVVFLLDKYPDMLELKNDHGGTCLGSACIRGKIQVVTHLIENKKANIETQGRAGRTPLLQAASEGHLPVVEYLLMKGANITAASAHNDLNSLAVHLASELGHLDIVRLLVKRKPDLVNAINCNSDTPLVRAAMGNQVAVMRFFVEECRCSIDMRGYSGRTVLLSAVQRGQQEAIDYCLSKGASLDTLSSKEDRENSAAHIAANSDKLDTLKFILEKKPKLLEQRNLAGETPLNRAANAGHLSTVQFLVEKKSANCENAGFHGRTPVMDAASNGFVAVVEYLARRRVNLLAKETADADHMNALHLAALFGHLEVVTFLVEFKPELMNIPDGKGRSALAIAQSRGRTEIVQYLLGRGCKP